MTPTSINRPGIAPTPTRILIAGIGNMFLGDDGFGVAAAQRCAERPWPAGVQVRDFGLRCLDLAYALLEGWDAAILLDAVPRGQAPGTLYCIDLDPGDAPNSHAPAPDGHSIDLAHVRSLALSLRPPGAAPLPRLLLVGCEPQRLEPEWEEGAEPLSPLVSAAVPAAVELVLGLVADLAAPSPTFPSSEAITV